MFTSRRIGTKQALRLLLLSTHRTLSQRLRHRHPQTNLMEALLLPSDTSLLDIVIQGQKERTRGRIQGLQLERMRTVRLKNCRMQLVAWITGAPKTHDERRRHRKHHCLNCRTWHRTHSFAAGKRMRISLAGWEVFLKDR